MYITFTLHIFYFGFAIIIFGALTTTLHVGVWHHGTLVAPLDVTTARCLGHWPC